MSSIKGSLHETEVSPQQVNFGTTGDKFIWRPGRPINVIRWGMIADATVTIVSMILLCDKRITAGSDTGRIVGSVAAGVDTAGGSLTLTANVAAGKCKYHDVIVAGGLKVSPGEELVFKVSAAATSGTGSFFLEYEPIAFQGEGSAVGTAITDSNRIFNMTKVAS